MGAAVPAVLDVAQERQSELVGIDLAGRRRERAGVLVAVVRELRLVEELRRHQAAVDPTRPALVEDLGHRLRSEVVRLLADDVDAVGLPVRERRPAEQLFVDRSPAHGRAIEGEHDAVTE